jgi:nickel transport protein
MDVIFVEPINESMLKPTFVFMLALFALGTRAGAHSVHIEVTRNAPMVSVHTWFSRTAPLADARVVIYAPGSDQPYQTGQTDRRGFFAFVPSAAGEWIFEVDDHRGHRKKVNIGIDESFISGLTPEKESPAEDAAGDDAAPVVEKETPEPDGTNFYYRLIAGLALIFGVSGIFYGIRASQSARKKE